MSNINNIGFNNKAWGNMGSGMVQFQQQQHQVFQNAMSLQQQNLGLGLQQMASNAMNASLSSGISSNPLFQQVAYPNTRGLNSTAFQTNISSVPSVQNNSGSGAKQRVFTGKITQIHDNFGLIDEEVIFQLNACVKGSNPAVGDRVLVEASYTPNMHFKWSASRVQVLTLNNQSRHSNSSKNYGNSTSYGSIPPPSEGRSARKMSNRRDRSRDRDKDDDEIERKRRREERIREREKEERKSPVRRRSRSPKARRRSRIVPRYMVQVPKIALDLSEADVLEVRRRYNNLYIPSDFFYTSIRWVDSFPPDKPFALNKPCSFHIMNKEVECATDNSATLEPSDADYLFSAKVMLMSVPAIEELYQKCCAISEYKERRERESEEKDFVHPTRLINFLVGLRGKNETMAIGGPWSPSLDGENPEKDPSVLIRTAIRTCKALTGVDLSSCTQWYRFVELYYQRSESTHKGKNIPARVETVVLFLPDVWSCLPTCLEWDGLQQLYKKQLERILKIQQDVNDDASTADEKEEEQANVKPEPTHYSQLDPKNMGVNDLRNELKARNISSKGLKSQLVARLVKTLKSEAEKNEEIDKEKEVESEAESVQEDKKVEVEEKEKKLDDKEKAILEKRYGLPEHPHILVHPSKTAKSGKFDCTVMSLSLLLDYRPEDTKEHSFEVSLFAELFNEMLIRDFGFNIFKALYELPDKLKDDKKEDKKDEKKEDKKDKDDKKDKKLKEDKKKEESEDKKDDKKKEEVKKPDQDSQISEKDTEMKAADDMSDKSDTKEQDKKRDGKKEEKPVDETEEDEDDDDDKDRKKDKNKKKKERVKLYTKDKHLLLSFVYFDQTHCGYIFDKDIEDLLFTLGLKLSRAQVRKLVSKVVIRDSLHYRKLTDKPKEDPPIVGENKKEVDLKELASGNKKLLPVFINEEMQSKGKKEVAGGRGKKMEEGFVVFQGAVVDVGKLKSQLERSENARLETESRMVSLKNDNQKMQEKINKSSSTIKHLNTEMKEYKDKLRDSEDTLSIISAYSKLYETTLIDIRDKIDPVLKSTAHKEEITCVKFKKEVEEKDKDKKYDESKSRWEKDGKKEEPPDVDML